MPQGDQQIMKRGIASSAFPMVPDAGKKPKRLRRTQKPLKRTRITNKVTPRRRRYLKIRSDWMRDEKNGFCKACFVLHKPGINPLADLHHKRGRDGELLFDRRYFMPVCRPCHIWIHDNKVEADNLGLIDLENWGKRDA